MSPAPALPPVQAYHPATFQERGVAVPFTSPLLAGARVRRGERHPVEIVVPNPSGGRGIYILPWVSVRALFRPTVHDSRLSRRITALKSLTPSAVRQAGLDMAMQGLAGRQAMEAARVTIAKEDEERLLTHFLLLMSLAEQAEPAARDRPASQHPSLEFERRGKQVIARVAPQLGQSPEDVLGALSALADVFSQTGVAMQTKPARIPRLLTQLTELQGMLVDWAQEYANDVHVDLADMVGDFADFAMNVTDVTLARTWELTKDMATLLRTWNKTPERITEIASRPAWVLDGWEQVCLLWNSSITKERQRAALTEMAQLVPVLPRQIAEWVKVPAGLNDNAASYAINLDQEWRTGAAVLHLTARNERLRALML